MPAIYLFTLNGIRVSFQPLFLLLIAVLSFNMANLAASLIFAACAIFAILAHEFGHAIMAKRYGLGAEVILTTWGGVTMHAPPRNNRQEILITAAGPAVGLVIGLSFYLLSLALGWMNLGPSIAKATYLFIFIRYMMWINIVWSIFNLLPVMPMDGGKLTAIFLKRRFKAETAAKISAILSFAFALAILVYALFNRSTFMIIIALFLIMGNFAPLRAALASNKIRKTKKANLEAEAIYERGLLAARNHRWKELEMLGYQMKQNANTKDQIERAYEFLTIATTNLFKYDEALECARHARKTDAVKQAVTRAQRMRKNK